MCSLVSLSRCSRCAAGGVPIAYGIGSAARGRAGGGMGSIQQIVVAKLPAALTRNKGARIR